MAGRRTTLGAGPAEARMADDHPMTSWGPGLPGLIAGLAHLPFVPPSAHDLGPRLDEVLDAALASTSARAGILYVLEGAALRAVAHRTSGAPAIRCLAPDAETWCGLPRYVAETGESVNVEDVRAVGHGVPYSHDLLTECAGLDEPFSIIAVPLVSPSRESIGVIELVDARDTEGRPVAFPAHAPIVLQALAGQAGTAIANAQLAARLREAQFETVFRLSVAAEFRDPETAAHIQRMSRYTAVIARNLGLSGDDVEMARFASPMHDVGKLGIPDSILLKEGKLTDDEWHIMRSHTTMGAKILGGSESPIMKTSENVALTHHEKMNGSGYPLGTKGDEIPLFGRMTALSDAFDAITSQRCYKMAQPLDVGLEIAQSDAGAHFDPDCVRALARGFDEIRRVHEQFQPLEGGR